LVGSRELKSPVGKPLTIHSTIVVGLLRVDWLARLTRLTQPSKEMVLLPRSPVHKTIEGRW
jgi:hypothetical protein